METVSYDCVYILLCAKSVVVLIEFLTKQRRQHGKEEQKLWY